MVIIIPVCIILSITYGRTAWATFTNKPGFYGNLYIYYDVNRIFFGIYNTIVLLIALFILIQILRCIRAKSIKSLKYSYWLSITLLLILTLGELYLQSNFQGKG